VLLATKPHHNPSGRERCAMAGRTYQKVTRRRLSFLGQDCARGSAARDGNGSQWSLGAVVVRMEDVTAPGRCVWWRAAWKAGTWQARPGQLAPSEYLINWTTPSHSERKHKTGLTMCIYRLQFTLFFIPSSMPESFTFASYAAPHSPCHSTEEAVLRAPRGPSFSLCILLHTVVVVVVVYQT
jgi:hypothetical protein